MVCDPSTKLSRGTAFVCFTERGAAEKALAEKSIRLLGHPVEVEYALLASCTQYTLVRLPISVGTRVPVTASGVGGWSLTRMYYLALALPALPAFAPLAHRCRQVLLATDKTTATSTAEERKEAAKKKDLSRRNLHLAKLGLVQPVTHPVSHCAG